MKFWWFVAFSIIGILSIAVWLNPQAENFFLILIGSFGVSYLLGVIAIYGMYSVIYYGFYLIFENIFLSKETLTNSLVSVTNTQHQLSKTELHRISVILRRSLADVWILNTPMDEAKIKRGLTSIQDNSSQITHFEFDRIKWIFDKGQQKLRWIRLGLIAILIFGGFIAGCVVGVYLQNKYHFLN